jgi:hypothetical protein
MAERLAALAVLLAGGVYLTLALPYPRGIAARPGPGFFPLLTGTLLCLAAAGFLVETFRRRPPRDASEAALTGDAWTRVLVTSVALAGFCLALPWVGYAVVTLVFVAVMLRALGGGWTLALCTGALGAAASYYVFAVLLGVPLPKGALFD